MVLEQLRVLLGPRNGAGSGTESPVLRAEEPREWGSGAVWGRGAQWGGGPTGSVPMEGPSPPSAALVQREGFPAHLEPLGSSFQSNYVPGLKQMLIQSYFSC